MIEDGALGSLGRVYDVTVLSRPGNRGARMTALEASLFDSGRPLLMAPPTSAQDVRRIRYHPLERQHRDRPRHVHGHAPPAQGQTRSAADA